MNLQKVGEVSQLQSNFKLLYRPHKQAGQLTCAVSSTGLEVAAAQLRIREIISSYPMSCSNQLHRATQMFTSKIANTYSSGPGKAYWDRAFQSGTTPSPGDPLAFSSPP